MYHCIDNWDMYRIGGMSHRVVFRQDNQQIDVCWCRNLLVGSVLADVMNEGIGIKSLGPVIAEPSKLVQIGDVPITIEGVKYPSLKLFLSKINPFKGREQ